MDVTEYDHIDVWRGACVGGGSVVFTGAMPQPTRVNFDAIFQGKVDYDEMNSVFYPRTFPHAGRATRRARSAASGTGTWCGRN